MDWRKDKLARQILTDLVKLGAPVRPKAERASAEPPPPFAHRVPACFIAAEWDAWHQAARWANPGPLGPCMDCTPLCQRAMVKAGKCERPMVRFRRDLDGALEAYIPKVSE